MCVYTVCVYGVCVYGVCVCTEWSPQMTISFKELPTCKEENQLWRGTNPHHLRRSLKDFPETNKNESQKEMDEKVNSASNETAESLTFREQLADITGKSTNAPVQTALCSPKPEGKDA